MSTCYVSRSLGGQQMPASLPNICVLQPMCYACRHAHAAAESPLQTGGDRCTTVKQAVSAQMSRAMQQSADVLLGEDCIVLYHQTSPENAEAIIRSGCMKPGPKFPLSHGGSGLYFAPDPLVIACADF